MKKKLSLILAALLVCGTIPSFASCDQEIKNVILIIGDGMGENHIENTLSYFDLSTPKFIKDKQCYIGTNSLNPVTDSAAAGTALATGTKVANGSVARHEGVDLTSISELALAAGKKVGVVTTDTLDGATPSAFSAHANNRNDSADIIECQINSGIHLLMGKTGSNYLKHSETFIENGYSFAYDTQSLYQYQDSEKLLANIPDVSSEYIKENGYAFQLKKMAEFAIEFLDNEEGYFLMIEGAYIDKYSHNNNLHAALSETRSLIDTINYLYKKVGRDTAIIITADHETGDLQKATSKEELDEFLYRSDDHTDTRVPLFAKNFTYDFGENPENTVVFEACKYLLGL